MSTPLSGISRSISAYQNPTLTLKAQLEVTSCGKDTNPCRDHLSLLVPPPSLGTNMFTCSVGQVAFCPSL